MIVRFPPFVILAVSALIAFLTAGFAFSIALNQPYLGIKLSSLPMSGLIQVESVDPDGPSADIVPGAPLLSINGFSLEAGDIIEEPDVAENYQVLERFLIRQGRILEAKKQAQVILVGGHSGETRTVISPRQTRPIKSLTPVFWTQIVLGISSLLIGTWVWSLKRGELAAQLLALAGLSALVAAFSAAIYSSRELALPGDLFRTLSAINHFGTLGFCAAMFALFLVYPRRLVRAGLLMVLPIVTFIIWIMDTWWIFLPGPTVGLHLPVVVMTLGILASAFLQHRATKNDPASRTALRWFTLSFGIGVGTFVATILLPNLFGLAPVLSQGYAALFVLLFFVGVALGVVRYRLFELENWAFLILFYFGGVVLLLLLDAVLITLVAFERTPAFALSLLLVALVYLPSRDWMARWLARERNINRSELFRQVVDVALTKDSSDQEHGWQRVLRDVFDPLQLTREGGVDRSEPKIADEGLALLIPGFHGISPVRLSYAHGGRRLFSPKDRRLAAEIGTMLSYAIASRNSHEMGASQERARIARDMHDNIGAQLLTALHSEEPGRKDSMIRETIADLRDIINNVSRGGKDLGEALTDLKLETRERLAFADIALDWQQAIAQHEDVPLAPNAVHSLRSMMREAVSNTVRHSGARSMTIRVLVKNSNLVLDVCDNGKGADQSSKQNGYGRDGSGLSNIESRIGALNGEITLENSQNGFVIRAEVPLSEISVS